MEQTLNNPTPRNHKQSAMEELFADSYLPVIKEVNRELFKDEALLSDKIFDVSEFLLQNNFQYLSLDDLSRQFQELERETNKCLVEEVSSSYQDYLSLCKDFRFKDESLILSTLQESTHELTKFELKLENLINNRIMSSSETITDTIEYLKSLGTLKEYLKKHTRLNEHFQFVRKLCQSLQGLAVDAINTNDELGAELLSELLRRLQSGSHILSDLNDTDSPLLKKFRNDHQSLIQQFHDIVLIWATKCCDRPNDYPLITKKLLQLDKIKFTT